MPKDKENAKHLLAVINNLLGRRTDEPYRVADPYGMEKPKRKRTLSAWNKFVKANSNKKKFQYANGKLKLKKMGIAYRKKKR